MRPLVGVIGNEIDPEETVLDIFGKSTYDLEELRGLIDEEKYEVTDQAWTDAVALRYASYTEMASEVMRLTKANIYKTMESEKKPGLWQDVYHLRDKNGVELYIKLQKNRKGNAVIIAFKKK